MPSYYQHHLFFCANVRTDHKACCSDFNAKASYRYAKDKCRAMGLLGQGNIGISESRCLGRCESGPIIVVYPDNIWYQYIDEQDIDEIIQSHLINHTPVKRLQLTDS